MTEPQTKKPARGCLFYTVIVGVFLVIVLLIGAYFGLRYARGIVSQLTDTQPMPLPTVELPADELGRLRERVDDFRTAVQDEQPIAPLALTGTEVNALIATDPDMAPLRNHVFVSIEGDRLGLQVSILAADIGLESLRGRYVNATGTFAVSLKTNTLQITAETLSAKGKPLPEHVMRQIRGENLAQKLNENPRVAAGLRKIRDIQVKDGKLIIVPKTGG